MKTIIQSIVALTATVGMLFAEEHQKLADLSKAFPTEKLEIAHRDGGVEWYLFQTNLEFPELTRKLMDILREGWVLAEHDREAEAEVKAQVEAQGQAKVLDMAVIRNDAQSNITVSLHHTEQRANTGGRVRYASILRSDKEKEGSRKITPSQLTRSAAVSGNAWAQRELGFAYFTGRGVEKSPADAIKWWQKSAEQGDALAQFSLGGCYDLGHGVPKDPARAFELFRQAADQGVPSAHYALGTCYDSGKGVQRNLEKAAEHFLKAAEWNHVDAQFNLAVSYIIGEGVEKNPAEAYAWFRLANRAGGRAQRQLDDLDKRLPSEIIKAGKERTEELTKVIESNLATKRKSVKEAAQQR